MNLKNKGSLPVLINSFFTFLLIIAVLLLAKPEADPAGSIDAAENLVVHFINVGQGDAALIQTPEGEFILIDAGPGSAESTLYNYLKARKVEEIALAVFTHPHEDHIGGADMVLKNFRVKKVLMPDAEHDSSAFRKVVELLLEQEIETVFPAVSDTFSYGGLTLTVLAPHSAAYDSLNNYSIVLRAEYEGKSILFAADAEVLSEKEMLSDRLTLASDILKVGHHGSNSSSTASFIKNVRPAYAVISAGEGNSYGHPHAEVLDRLEKAGAQIFRTDTDGTILVTLGSGGIFVTRSRSLK